MKGGRKFLTIPDCPVHFVFRGFFHAVVEGGEEVAAYALFEAVDGAGIALEGVVRAFIGHHKPDCVIQAVAVAGE